MVGCGALGCEFLKNFALMGVAAGDKGLVTVTDNDRIEVSNLNRQFLFREHNVGQPKSVAAADAVVAMNPALRVKAMESLVCPDTEPTFNDQFWEAQDFVTNALDNVKARLYVDDRCVGRARGVLPNTHTRAHTFSLSLCLSHTHMHVYTLIRTLTASPCSSPSSPQLRVLREAAAGVGHAGHQVQRAGHSAAQDRVVL